MVQTFEAKIRELSETLSNMDVNVGRFHTLEGHLDLNTRVEAKLNELDEMLEDLSAEVAVLLRSRFLQHRFAIRELLKVNSGTKRRTSTNVFQIAEAVEAEPDDEIRERYCSMFQKHFGYPITDVLE